MGLNTLLEKTVYKLICDTSCSIPEDVKSAIQLALSREKKASIPYNQLLTILKNIEIAGLKKRPVCQDTGNLFFLAKGPLSLDRQSFRKAVENAIVQATEDGFLRKNSICPITGKNTGNNLGPGSPTICWEEETSKKLKIKLLLKGGGSENVGQQYSLPDNKLNAERNLDGIRRCVLDAVYQAQGKGCPPGAVGICIGGDRANAFMEAKKIFFRNIGERNKKTELAEFESRLLEEINSLGIGTMGLGGKTTALEVFITTLNRLPACYYVTVSQICWAWRKREIELDIH